MKIIKASYEILTSLNAPLVLEKIEQAGRTCYKSEEKQTYDSSLKFIKMLINRGHESVLEHQSLSIKFICDRGVSHEIVRHRLCSFSQESTRYCNYSKSKFGGELTFIDLSQYLTESQRVQWELSLQFSETTYLALTQMGCSAQIARSVLPNSLKTEIVVTTNLREWRTIFKQRTSEAAHPQMRELMIPLLKELKNTLPIIFDDIIC